jgi:hypothetical protein
MFFRVVAHKADNFSIVVVTYNAEQSSALLATSEKMVEFEYLHEFKTICEFTLGFQSGASADVFY